MIKAKGTEFCSWCHLGTARGEDLLEGSAGPADDSGALYHGDCYSALNRAEGGEFDDADHDRAFRAWQKHFGAR
jgi:hypothetical protein